MNNSSSSSSSSSSNNYDMMNMGTSSKVLYQSMAGKLLPLLRKHQLLSGDPSAAAADSRTPAVTRDALVIACLLVHSCPIV